MSQLFRELFKSVNKQDDLEKILDNSKTEDLITAISSRIKDADGYAVWNAILESDEVPLDKIFTVSSRRNHNKGSS